MPRPQLPKITQKELRDLEESRLAVDRIARSSKPVEGALPQGPGASPDGAARGSRLEGHPQSGTLT